MKKATVSSILYLSILLLFLFNKLDSKAQDKQRIAETSPKSGFSWFKKDTFHNFKGVDISKDSLDSYLQSKVKELKIIGLSIAIINKGKVVQHRTMGYANLEQKLSVTDKTIFEGASMSKSVFAFFVMKYVEEGKLNLDKPLYEYLPYPDIAYDERYKKITARIVLSHRSGFPNWREKDKKLTIKFEPGTDYLYSGEGYQYLAMVLKHLDNTDWNGLEAAFQKKVARPLGMKHTVFIQTPYTISNKAEAHEKGKRANANKDKFVAAASIHSEPIDFSKWMIAVMKKKLLSKESYNELFKRHSSLPNSGINLYYTLGFHTSDNLYSNLYFHSGNNGGFTCYYIMDIEKDWGYVLFANSENGEELGNELFNYLAELQ